MSQALKQLKIKTSMLKRLRKEYESYKKETTTIQNKIEQLEANLVLVQKDQELQIQVRKNKQFLNESISVLSNVKQKFIEAFEGLVTYLSEKGGDEGVTGTLQKQTAENLVLQIETFLQNID